MRSSIVDIAGGTFVVTGISYATGIAYYNAFFRKINGNPDLFSVSLERILFEGGRQLLHIAFKPALIVIAATLVFAIANSILKKIGSSFLERLLTSTKNSSIGKSVHTISWAYLFVIMSVITSYSFTSGKEAGEKYAASTTCTRASIVTEKKSIIGCLIYKSDSEVWLITIDKDQKVLLNIPNDKYLSISIY